MSDRRGIGFRIGIVLLDESTGSQSSRSEAFSLHSIVPLSPRLVASPGRMKVRFDLDSQRKYGMKFEVGGW